MDKDILLEGRTLISARRASEKFGYSQDYIGQLARAGSIQAKLIGRTWFVDLEGLRLHKQAKSSRRKEVDELITASRTTLPSKGEMRYECEPVVLMPTLTKKPAGSPWRLRRKIVVETVLACSLVLVALGSGFFWLKSFAPVLAERALDLLASIYTSI